MMMSSIAPTTDKRAGTWLLIGSIALLLVMGVANTGAAELSSRTFLSVPLHTAMEIFSVVVCAMIFAVGWSTFDAQRPRYIIVLSCALLSAGLIDTVHLLSYPGMPPFVTANAAQKSIFFWLLARGVIAVALLHTAFSQWRPFRNANSRHLYLFAALLWAGLCTWLGLNHLDKMPLFFVEGTGLTVIKIALEFLFAGAYALAGFVFLRIYRRTQQGWVYDLALCCLTMTVSELYFTLFRAPWDVLIFLGHAYKVIAYFFLYRAIFVRSVRQPIEKLAASEAALRHSESELRRIQIAVENSTDCIFMFDADGHFIYVNARACQQLGYPRPQLLAMRVADFVVSFPEGDWEWHWRHLQRSGALLLETKSYRQNGEIFPIEVSVTLIDEGERQFGCAIMRDISERMQSEQKIRASMLNEERARVEAQTKSAFLAQMSHEIRTPMNGILGVSELLLGSGLNDMQQGYCRIIHSSATALLTVINDVLDISKIEAGRMRIEHLPFNLRQVVDEVVSLLKVRAQEKQLTLHIDIDEKSPAWVLGDPTRLRQILLNYLSNAIKFTLQGDIHLRVVALGAERFRFEVKDTGPGIAPEVLPRLFDLFAQADTSVARVHGGTGLGLVISKRLAELMGGSVGVDSEPGRGSRFWVELTLSATTQPAIANVPAPLEQRRMTLLVVEDNRVNRLVIDALLTKLGHHALMAESGEQAIAIYREHRAEIDAILMDCEMPGMDGFEATRRLRALEIDSRWPRCPILAVSAHALEEFVQRGREAGMDGHIAKPLTLAQLQASLSGGAAWSTQKESDTQRAAG